VRLGENPALREAAVSLAILAGSYLAARTLSFLFGKVLARAARRTATRLDDRLIAAVKRPLTYALFLVGAYAALHRSPLPDAWTARLDALLFVLGVLLVSLALARALSIFLEWYATGSDSAQAGAVGVEFGPLLNKLGRAVIGLVAAITVLQHLGVNVASLVVSLGVGSLAIGLAAQDTLANLFAGFTLTLDRPFAVGDRIQLTTGEMGDVVTIGMRSTRVRTLDETYVIVPNAVLVKDRLVNLTRPTRAMTVRVDVAVAYGSDLDRAKAVLAEAAAACSYLAPDSQPVVVVTALAEFAINLRVVLLARDYAEAHLARSQVIEEIVRRLDAAGIEIPYPTRRIIQEA